MLKPHWREDKTEKVIEGTLASHYLSFFHIGPFIHIVVRKHHILSNCVSTGGCNKSQLLLVTSIVYMCARDSTVLRSGADV